ncbi:MAG: NUDIX hydrolase [Candidatus Promineifilaceae bacterium]
MMLKAKQTVMQLTRLGIVRWLMRIAVRLIVPKRRVGAAIAVFDEDGKVLLLKHAFHGQHPWALPGGWVNKYEEPAHAVIRELREETGLSAELDRPIHVTISPVLNNLDVFYRGFRPQGDIHLSFEIVDSGWFDPADLPDGMLGKTRDAIRAAQGTVTP